MLRWREFSGRPGQRLLEKLNDSILRYQQAHRFIRVGLTTEPVQRWREVRLEGWSEMVVIYSSSNQKYVGAVERDLADCGWGANYATWNYTDPNGGLPGSYTRYYVYVLLG